MVLLLRSCTSTTFERTAAIVPATATPALAAPLRACGAFDGLTVDDLKLLLLDFVVGLFVESATERLPCGVPDGAALFFVVFVVLLFVFLGLELLAAATGFLSVLTVVSASV